MSVEVTTDETRFEGRYEVSTHADAVGGGGAGINNGGMDLLNGGGTGGVDDGDTAGAVADGWAGINNYPYHLWKFGTMNIRSGKEKSEGARIYTITKEVANAKLSFCSLQEVKYRGNGNEIISLPSGEKYAFIWCGMKKRREAGVAILIKVCSDIEFEEPDILDPRLIAINIQIRGFKLRLINVYSPTNSDGSEAAKDLFYKKIRNACKKHCRNQKLIINGDFNATTSMSLYQSYFDGKATMEDPLCNDNGMRIKAFCREMKVVMTQTYFDHPVNERYTWYSPNSVTKKVLVYILMEPFINNYTLECKVLTSNELDIDSDHRMAIMKTPLTKQARKQQEKIPNKIKIDFKVA